MSDRESQRRIDDFVARFLEALEDGDLDAQEEIWQAAALDEELETALIAAARELASQYEQDFRESAGGMLETAVRLAMPTADVIRHPFGPVTVAEVVEQIRRGGSPGLTSMDLALNDRLSGLQDPVPENLGLSAVIAWGGHYGEAPAGYWRQFRQAAISLRLRRESNAEYRHAARPKPPRKLGDRQ